eukprot:scaffold4145_cov115-Isochrysis_galbana.AAC.35
MVEWLGRVAGADHASRSVGAQHTSQQRATCHLQHGCPSSRVRVAVSQSCTPQHHMHTAIKCSTHDAADSFSFVHRPTSRHKTCEILECPASPVH